MTAAAVAAIVTLALALAGAVGVVTWLAYRAMRAVERASDERADRIGATFDVELAKREVAQAARSIDEATRALARQTARADALEAEIHELEASPVALVDPAARAGRARLREALRRAADVPGGAGGEEGTPAMPDAAAAGPADSPGD